MTALARLDPPGCGCTDCLTGHSKPLDDATAADMMALYHGQLTDATATELAWYVLVRPAGAPDGQRWSWRVRPETRPPAHAEHTPAGPESCARCQLLRDNREWLGL